MLEKLKKPAIIVIGTKAAALRLIIKTRITEFIHRSPSSCDRV